MDYWQSIENASRGIRDVGIQSQLTAMRDWTACVAAGMIPAHPLPRLGLGDDVWLSSVPLSQLRQLDALLRNFRFQIAHRYGMWGFINQDFANAWTTAFGPRRYLEVAAGNAYLSKALETAGNTCLATDALTWRSENPTGRKPLVPVHRSGATGALHRYAGQVDAVIMSWSPDRDWSDAHFLQTLRWHFPELPLFVLGERKSATNSQLFWQIAKRPIDRRLLRVNRFLPQFDAVNERLYLVS